GIGQLEPDRCRRSAAYSAFHAESKDQAPEHRRETQGWVGAGERVGCGDSPRTETGGHEAEAVFAPTGLTLSNRLRWISVSLRFYPREGLGKCPRRRCPIRDPPAGRISGRTLQYAPPSAKSVMASAHRTCIHRNPAGRI